MYRSYLAKLRKNNSFSPARFVLLTGCLLLLSAAPANFIRPTRAQGPPQSAPAGLTVTPSKDKFIVSWGAVANTDYYVLCRSNADGSSFYCAHTIDTTYQWGSVYIGQTYNFQVLARNSVGDSPWSALASGTLTLDAPIISATPGKAKITVSWSTVADADTYKVCWANADNPTSINCLMGLTVTSREFSGGFYNGNTYILDVIRNKV